MATLWHVVRLAPMPCSSGIRAGTSSYIGPRIRVLLPRVSTLGVPDPHPHPSAPWRPGNPPLNGVRNGKSRLSGFRWDNCQAGGASCRDTEITQIAKCDTCIGNGYSVKDLPRA